MSVFVRSTCPGGVVRDLVFFFGVVPWGHPGLGISFDRGTLPGGVVRGLGEFFLRRGACGWAVAASAPCLRGERGVWY